jgi:hypothetical protein
MSASHVSAVLRKRIRCQQCREIERELKAAQLQLYRLSFKHTLSLHDRIQELRKLQDLRDELGSRLRMHKDTHNTKRSPTQPKLSAVTIDTRRRG